jgi:hypothetical protein
MMSDLAAVMLGLRLLFALLQNQAIVHEDRLVLRGIILTLLSGKQPTQEQIATFNDLTAKIIAGELSALIASGVIPAATP